jgi:sugar/nucleoside kinase (ribokinase family)
MQKKGEGQYSRGAASARAVTIRDLRIPFRIRPAGARPFDVVGLGLNSIDLLAVVAEYPPPDTKQRVQRFARLPGGQTATAMAACARLGWRARYIGRFGDDELGRLSLESLQQEGVDTSATRTIPGVPNQFAVILVDARSGGRTVLWDRHPALTMDQADVAEAAVTSGRVLVVDCHETAAATQAARYARAAGMTTIIDVEKVRPGVAELLLSIDAIIAARDFPTALTGHEELGRAIRTIGRDFGAPLVCVTLGEEGSLAWCNGLEIRTPAFPVDCIDTTGAGDAFRGAFAAGCLRAPEGEIEEVLTYANAVAALNCRALGARGGLPTPQEVERLIRPS